MAIYVYDDYHHCHCHHDIIMCADNNTKYCNINRDVGESEWLAIFH